MPTVQHMALTDDAQRDAKLSELIDWLKKLHFDDKLEGVVLLAVERKDGGLEGIVRGCLTYGEHDAMPSLLLLWIAEWEKQLEFLEAEPGGTS